MNADIAEEGQVPHATRRPAQEQRALLQATHLRQVSDGKPTWQSWCTGTKRQLDYVFSSVSTTQPYACCYHHWGDVGKKSDHRVVDVTIRLQDMRHQPSTTATKHAPWQPASLEDYWAEVQRLLGDETPRELSDCARVLGEAAKATASARAARVAAYAADAETLRRPRPAPHLEPQVLDAARGLPPTTGRASGRRGATTRKPGEVEQAETSTTTRTGPGSHRRCGGSESRTRSVARVVPELLGPPLGPQRQAAMADPLDRPTTGARPGQPLLGPRQDQRQGQTGSHMPCSHKCQRVLHTVCFRPCCAGHKVGTTRPTHGTWRRSLSSPSEHAHPQQRIGVR